VHQVGYLPGILYMFRAVLCSSSGGQIVCIQHMVSSLCMSGCGGCTIHWLRENWTEKWRSLCIKLVTGIKFVLGLSWLHGCWVLHPFLGWSAFLSGRVYSCTKLEMHVSFVLKIRCPVWCVGDQGWNVSCLRRQRQLNDASLYLTFGILIIAVNDRLMLGTRLLIIVVSTGFWNPQ
jgi:hypothetical protein